MVPPRMTDLWKPSKRAFHWLIALVCISYIVVYFARHQKDLRLVLTIPLWTLLYGCVLQGIQFLLFGFRLRGVLHKCSGARIPLLRWFQLLSVGSLLSQILPQMGVVYRSVRVKRDYGISYTEYVSGAVGYTWMDGALNLAAAFVIVSIVDPGLRIGPLNGALLLLGLLVMTLSVPIVLERIARSWKVRGRAVAWIQAKISEVLRVTLDNMRDGPYVLQFGLLGTCGFALTCTIFYVYLGALGAEVTLPGAALFAALFRLSRYVNVTPGNVGLREIVCGVLSEQLQMGMSEGILVSLLVRIVGQVVLVAFALPIVGMDLLRRDQRCS